MKKIYYSFMCVSMACLLWACNDAFLDRTPTNDLNEKSFWNTPADLEAYNNGIYNDAANNGAYKFMVGFAHAAWNSRTQSVYPLEAMSDNFVTMDASQIWASAVAAGVENVPSSSTSYGGWSWGILRRINVFLTNYQRVACDESVKNQYAGEALFFRAWFYLYMVQTYGDVPLITQPLQTDSEELYGARTPRKEVMKQVLEDINAACKYLPKDWGSKPNRITKGAALALKSRIGLYEGTYRKYHQLGDSEEFLQACVAAGEEAMTLGYEIYNTGNPTQDYTTLFTSEDLGKNPEVMLYRKYADDLLGHRMCGYLLNLRNGGTKDFADDFLRIDADGKARPIGLSSEYSNDTPEQEFAQRDARMAQTFLAPGNEAAKALFQDQVLALKNFPRLGDMPNWPTLTGYHVVKYYVREQDKKGFGKETHDYPLLRYAEVLLNVAEAKAELGTISQADLDKTVNLLRRRAGVPDLELTPAMDPKYADLGLSALLVEIRRERRVELSFEQLRYQDLMRWAQGEKLKERVLGMRLEDADFNDPRYEGKIKKYGTSGGKNYVYTALGKDGKQYVDPYGGTNFAAERRTFDPKKDYLRPLPKSALSKNAALVQNPFWDQ